MKQAFWTSAGGASGMHKAKLNVRAAGSAANVLLAAVHIMGVDQDSVGDSTGEIPL